HGRDRRRGRGAGLAAADDRCRHRVLLPRSHELPLPRPPARFIAPAFDPGVSQDPAPDHIAAGARVRRASARSRGAACTHGGTDHPIGSAPVNTVCGDTADTCKTYVTMNLTDAADTMLAADIMTACTQYLADRAG